MTLKAHDWPLSFDGLFIVKALICSDCFVRQSQGQAIELMMHLLPREDQTLAYPVHPQPQTLRSPQVLPPTDRKHFVASRNPKSGNLWSRFQTSRSENLMHQRHVFNHQDNGSQRHVAVCEDPSLA
jgi:hypothetical protein